MKFADLHIHTNFSDSSYSPSDVVHLSVKEGLSCIGITDHDTVDGIRPIMKEARHKNLEVIPGIEMSTEVNGQEVHILGYFIDYRNKAFLRRLAQLKKIRINRIYKMVKKLKALGLKDISAKEVFDLSGKGAVGRVHLAWVMQRKGYVDSFARAFHKFIGDGKPACVSKFRFSPKQVINSIHKAGGISVIAHPHNLARQEIIHEFIDYGLKGIEVYYSNYTNSQIKGYISLAKKYGLLITGGSDSHGDAKENTAIGKVRIPYELVEELKKSR